jgi:SNF2 family DNA or RNA helicase
MKAHADIADGKLVLATDSRSGRFEDLLAACKAVPGARWHKQTKTWRYPLAVETCHELRRVWGGGLSVSPALGAWYKQEAAGRAVQVARASQTDATLVRLPEVAPALASTLRPDQRVAVAWVASGYRNSGLLCDQPGLGKTLETIGGILESGTQGPVLIVCPKLSVKRVWQREWKKWAPDVRVYAARGTRQRRQKNIDMFHADPSPLKVLIVVAEMLRIKEEPDPSDYTGKKKIFVGYEYPELQRPWSWVVVDESHKLFGSLTVVKGNLAGKGVDRIIADRKLAVTGTPFGKGGRLQGMFGTLKWLWPDEFTSFWRWAETYFEIEEEKVYIKGGRGQTRTTKKVGGLRKGSEEDFLNSFGPRLLRRTKAEVLPNLPPKQYIEVMCEMEGLQLQQYVMLSQEAEVPTPNGIIIANGVLAELTRAKQVANGALGIDPATEKVFFTGDSGKLDVLMQMLEQRGILDGDGDLKVLVASQFNEFLSVVENRLQEAGVGYHIITGKTSDTKRDKAMEEFQNDGGHRVFLLNAKAGGVSVTLDAADEVHCLDELYNPEDQEQLEDRAHRASRNHQVRIYHYRTEGTIDEQIATNVEGKRQAQHAVLDGRRGLEYARELIRYRKPADA